MVKSKIQLEFFAAFGLLAAAFFLGLLTRPLLREVPGAAAMLFLWAIAAVGLRANRAVTICTVVASDVLLTLFFPLEARFHSATALSAGRFVGFGVLGASLGYLTHRYRSAMLRDAASKSLLQDFMRSAPVGFSLHSTDGRYLEVNPQLAEWNGMPAEAQVGKLPSEVFPNLGKTIEPMLRQVGSTGVGVTSQIKGDTLDPSRERYWRASYFPVRDSSGRVKAVGTAVLDTTAEEAAQRALDESRRVLSFVLDSAGFATWVWNMQTDEIQDLGNTSKLFRIPNLKHFSQFAPLVHPEDELTLRQEIESAKESSHFDAEYRLLPPDGAVRWVRSMGAILEDKVRMAGITLDVTNRVQLQQAVIESEKLAVTGRMAAAIAHEINNPLDAATGLAYVLMDEPGLPERARTFVHMILEELGRASEVSRQSLGYFRDSGKPSGFDMCALVQGLAKLNEPLLHRKRVNLVVDFPGSCLAFGTKSEVRQVFANLLKNALDAVPEGGKIILRVRTRVRGGQSLVSIMIADSGHGIAPEKLQHLFQPFFTTKGSKGNGLGLWISKGIVAKHGGRIRIKSSVAEGRSGTAFLVDIPAMEVPAAD